MKATTCKLITTLALVLTSVTMRASIITFEDLPTSMIINVGAGNPIGNFYTGVTFSSGVTGLSTDASNPYPPHSGSIVAFDPGNGTITIQFSTTLSAVQLYYTSFDQLTLSAFSTFLPGGAPIGTTIGVANTDGIDPGNSALLSLNVTGIQSITLTGGGNQYVFDDLTFTPQGGSPVPEPATGLLLALGLVGVARHNRVRRGGRLSNSSKAKHETVAREGCVRETA